MRMLALEPYYGGSHRAFLDGWIARSSHEWTLLTLPATKWKWRMRHAAITFSDQVREMQPVTESWDCIFCSDMLNLADFRGLAPTGVAALPAVAYFHENQLTYPVLQESERDYHFVFSNMVSALSATAVWFNSAFHRDSFLDELGKFLRRMPDHHLLSAVEKIRGKTGVYSPCIDGFPPRAERLPGPMRILWAARWEPDKAPERFFRALEELEGMGTDFQVSVIGGCEGRMPLPVFAQARERFAGHILRWGYQESREDYEAALREADVVVSTADHEFFGIGVVEAASAGAFPLLPRRLAYPEVFAGTDDAGKDPFFYDGNEHELAGRLGQLADRLEGDDIWQGDPLRAVRAAEQFTWGRNIPEWDAELDEHVRAADRG